MELRGAATQQIPSGSRSGWRTPREVEERQAYLILSQQSAGSLKESQRCTKVTMRVLARTPSSGPLSPAVERGRFDVLHEPERIGRPATLQSGLGEGRTCLPRGESEGWAG